MSTENEYTPLIAEARARATAFNDAGLRYGVADLLNGLANALEAATADRTEVAAKALEEVADGSSLVVIAEWLRAHAAVLRASSGTNR